MTRDAPTKEGGWVGGTAFERMAKSPGVKGGRCRSLTQTHQRVRRVAGPCAETKLPDVSIPEADWPPVRKTHKLAVEVSRNMSHYSNL